MELEIRKITQADEFPYDLLLLADPSREIVEEYVKRGDCYGAYLNDEVIGEYVLIRTRPETVEIVNVAVREDYQGRGIGKKLVLHAIESAQRENMKTVEIGTGNSGVQQLALYQKCGFRIVGVDPDFFVRHYDEEIYENGIQCRDMVRLRLELP